MGHSTLRPAVGPRVLVERRSRPWLSLAAVAGPVLFTVAWFVLGFLSPGYVLFGTLFAPYSPVSQPISGLGLGPTAPFMNAAFVLGGLLLLAGVVVSFRGIREIGTASRWICTLLFVLVPIGMLIDGIFTFESFMPHMLGFILGSGTPVLSFLIAGILLRGVPRWQRFGNGLLLASPLTLLLFVLALTTFDPLAAGAGLGVAGLTQRVLIIEVLVWFVALGWLTFRRS